MRVLSLFSGIGGFDLGLERAGMEIVGQVEIDPYCQKVLVKHWPEVKRMGDIHDVRGDEFGAVDLIAGGFPCQPVSHAGERKAQSDERWLWPEYARLIRAIRPSYVLVENVPGLLDGPLADVLGDLAACGFDAEWDCIPAAAIGAPHLRDRVWLLAYADGGAERSESGIEQAPRPAIFAGSRTADVPDTECGHVEEHGLQHRPSACACGKASDGLGDVGSVGGGWWLSEPDVGRVVDGLSATVVRRGHALGNAVVPQIVEYIGRRIMEIDK